MSSKIMISIMGFHLIMPMDASLKRDACLIGDTVIAVFLLILLTWNAWPFYTFWTHESVGDESTGLKWDDKEPIRQWYDLKYKHITKQSRSYLVQELISVEYFCMHSCLGTVRMDCVHGIKRSNLFSVFPLTKRNDSLIYKCFFCP